MEKRILSQQCTLTCLFIFRFLSHFLTSLNDLAQVIKLWRLIFWLNTFSTGSLSFSLFFLRNLNQPMAIIQDHLNVTEFHQLNDGFSNIFLDWKLTKNSWNKLVSNLIYKKKRKENWNLMIQKRIFVGQILDSGPNSSGRKFWFVYWINQNLFGQTESRQMQANMKYSEYD